MSPPCTAETVSYSCRCLMMYIFRPSACSRLYLLTLLSPAPRVPHMNSLSRSSRFPAACSSSGSLHCISAPGHGALWLITYESESSESLSNVSVLGAVELPSATAPLRLLSVKRTSDGGMEATLSSCASHQHNLKSFPRPLHDSGTSKSSGTLIGDMSTRTK